MDAPSITQSIKEARAFLAARRGAVPATLLTNLAAQLAMHISQLPGLALGDASAIMHELADEPYGDKTDLVTKALDARLAASAAAPVDERATANGGRTQNWILSKIMLLNQTGMSSATRISPSIPRWRGLYIG